jgi:hypothetical protein
MGVGMGVIMVEGKRGLRLKIAHNSPPIATPTKSKKKIPRRPHKNLHTPKDQGRRKRKKCSIKKTRNKRKWINSDLNRNK